MRFTCTRFPDGEVPIRTRAGVVMFRGGVADVDDPDLAKALLEVPASFGVAEDKPVKKAAKKAARGKE
ncbi:hypothetical protein [Glycomyces paridis]|uniref:Uncharacterized protein n=1 Tax=Glycomyces paridis TaxID=2126555 RepID=A0A4V6T6A1_9ACTN|nr:hypothetical protein [Glycomyces paridis]THV26006.1 hypothetical protein E9998_19930 [Glycomyces paridis]